MNTIFKKRFFIVAALFMMLLLASSCEDNLGVQVTAEAPNADKTLYQIIMQDKELTDFVEILDACNIPSSKSNEIVSVADSLFNTSRVYTVWAPVNDYLKNKKDSILKRISDGYRDDVMKTFVFSHVANFVKQAKGRFAENGEPILMLNNKKMVFAGSYKEEEGYTFGGSRLASVNERAKNGLLHKLEKSAEYNYNIWEYLKIYPKQSAQYKVDSLVDYLYSFNDTNFSERLSVRGPIVNGEETYLDSVFEYSNKLLTKYGGVGELDNEDSVYTFYLPTDDVWDAMMAKAEKHFNYAKSSDPEVQELVDSLKNLYSKSNFIKYLAYSDKEQRFVKNYPDSIMPAQTEYKRKLFAREDVEKCVVETKKMSNGTLKIINEYPYSIFDLWHDTIRIEAENTYYVDDKKTTYLPQVYYVAEKDMNENVKGKLSGSGYVFSGEGGNSNAKTELYYYLPNVKSAKYEVKVILVPRNIQNSMMNLDEYKPTKLKFQVKGKNAKGNITTKINKTKEVKKDQIDTISLGTVKFDICEYNSVKKVTDYGAQILIWGDNTPTGKWDNNIFLDAILLIPVEDK